MYSDKESADDSMYLHVERKRGRKTKLAFKSHLQHLQQQIPEHVYSNCTIVGVLIKIAKLKITSKNSQLYKESYMYMYTCTCTSKSESAGKILRLSESQEARSAATITRTHSCETTPYTCSFCTNPTPETLHRGSALKTTVWAGGGCARGRRWEG